MQFWLYRILYCCRFGCTMLHILNYILQPFYHQTVSITVSYPLTLHLTISHYIILIFQFCYCKVKQSKFHFNLIIISFFSFLLPVGKVYFVPMIFQQQQEQHNSSPPINHTTIYFYIILNKILIKRYVENEKPATEIIS